MQGSGSRAVRALYSVVLGVALLIAPATATALEPLSEPELTLLCRRDLGRSRWLFDMDATLRRLKALPPASTDDESKSRDTAVQAFTQCVESVQNNLGRVCDQLSARKAIEAESLKKVTDCYRTWAASPHPQEAERNTIYNVTQARDQVLLGLARSGSSRGQTPPVDTSLAQESRDLPPRRASDELTFFMLEVLNDRLCSAFSEATSSSPFVNVCRVLRGTRRLPASAAALSRAARRDLRKLPGWVARHLEKTDLQLACSLDVAQAFTTAAREGQPVFDVVSDTTVLAGLMEMAAPCELTLANLKPLLEAVRYARSYASFAALRDEGSYELLVSLATVDMPGIVPVKRAAEVLRRIDTMTTRFERMRTNSLLDPQVSASALAVLRPLLAEIHGTIHEPAIEPTVQGMTALLREDYPDAFVQLMSIDKLMATVDKVGPSASRALGIVAEIAATTTSAEVGVVLEQSALPLVSWRRKDEPRPGMTLSGIIGGHVAREFVNQRVAVQGAERDVANGVVLSPVAMVGVDVHRGFGWGRFGAFASLLDFGSIATTRLYTDEDAELQPEKGAKVGVQQLLSPGGYAYVGFGPFEVGAGVSWVPALRPVNVEGREEVLSVWRAGGFLSLDIPIVPLL